MTDINNQAKVFQLCSELEDTKRRKKQVVSAFNDEIKRLQAEIKDLVNPEEAVDIHGDELP
jgi:hypothetical protein